MLAALCIACCLLPSCTDKDNPVVEPDKPEAKDYQERIVPVVDPQGKAQGTVTLRFYDDMPSVAYVSISNFQGIMYPGTTVQVVGVYAKDKAWVKVSIDGKEYYMKKEFLK